MSLSDIGILISFFDIAKNAIYTDIFTLSEHWALAASLGYLYLTLLGMAQSGVLFAKYEINIFEFAELNDFLLAAFREPLSLLAGLGVLVYVGLAFSFIYRKRSRDLKSLSIFKSRSMTINLVASVVAMPFIIQIAFADLFKGSYERDVAIELRRGSLPGLTDISTTNFKLIGTSENFIFIYEDDSQRSYVVPVSNIVGVAVKP